MRMEQIQPSLLAFIGKNAESLRVSFGVDRDGQHMVEVMCVNYARNYTSANPNYALIGHYETDADALRTLREDFDADMLPCFQNAQSGLFA